jgi:hypothetical protein
MATVKHPTSRDTLLNPVPYRSSGIRAFTAVIGTADASVRYFVTEHLTVSSSFTR